MSSNKSILLFCKTAGNSFAKMCVCCLCINFLKKRRNFFSFTLPSFIFLSNWNTLEKFTTSFVKIVGRKQKEIHKKINEIKVSTLLVLQPNIESHFVLFVSLVIRQIGLYLIKKSSSLLLLMKIRRSSLSGFIYYITINEK